MDSRSFVSRSQVARAGLLAALAVTAGCTQQRIFMKEKIIERNAAPRAAIQVDRFLYKKAYGPVDFVFVVDNTESSEGFVEDWRTVYSEFLSGASRDEARQLDYRVQVVTTPGSISPANYYGPGLSKTAHLADLAQLLDNGERGYMTPLTSVSTALMRPEFLTRGYTPLWVVYALGDDVDPDAGGSYRVARAALAGRETASSKTPGGPALRSEDYENKYETEEEIIGEATGVNSGSPSFSGNTADFKKALDYYRGTYQTSSWMIARSLADSSQATYSNCSTFYPATGARAVISGLGLRESVDYDLCSVEWKNYPEPLWDSVIAFKKRLILSHPPYQPETMTLRSAAHLFRFGQDYYFDEKANELVFVGEPGLVEGDLLEVSYYLKPAEDILGGSPEPGASPSPVPGEG